MAAVSVDPGRVREFGDSDAFYAWLSEHHAREDEIWVKLHKRSSGLPSITAAEAIDAALCWGWIDAIKKSFDERSYLQRFTRRRPKSVWSEVNVENVARLIAEGRMTEHGLREVAAAKADGRWERAYGRSKTMVPPPDLVAAVEASPAANATFQKLNAKNRFALTFRLHQLKTLSGVKRRSPATSTCLHVARRSTHRRCEERILARAMRLPVGKAGVRKPRRCLRHGSLILA